MQFLDLTLRTLEENLALDEALLLRAEETGEESLRVWEWPQYAVVLGAGGKLHEDVNEAACLKGGVPIFRRSSGGGTVLLGEGCLLFSLVLGYRQAPELGLILPSYRFILERIARAVGGGCELTGTSDLACGGYKVSGNSQQRKKHHLLHHGTLLYRFNLGRIETYLHEPKRQPEYRQQRSHGEFLANLDLEGPEIKRRLWECWNAREVSGWPEKEVMRLVIEKYGNEEWIRRR